MHGMHPFTVIKIKVSSPTTATTIMNSSMSRFDKLDEMQQVLEIHSLPKLTQEQTI